MLLRTVRRPILRREVMAVISPAYPADNSTPEVAGLYWREWLDTSNPLVFGQEDWLRGRHYH
jgi:hypothetical protein